LETVTADMLISDVLATSPDAAKVFSKLGLGCPSCFAASMETLSAVASMHDVPVDVLIAELNSAGRGSVFEERT
jgi:hybrid cluster-associated redox disulfide protein